MRLVDIIVIIAMLILLVKAVSATGIGVAPSELIFKDALKGYSYEKEFKIDNTGDKDIIAEIDVISYRDLFSLSPGTSIRIPAKGSSKVKVTVNIPSNTSNGNYETMVYVKGKPADTSEGMGLIPGAGFKALISVTDKKIVKGYVDNILTRDTTLNGKVNFIIGFWNQGNVEAKPNAKIAIKMENDEFVASFEKEFLAKAGASESLLAEYDTKGKALGEYKADVQIYLNNELLDEKTVYFKIVEKMPSGEVAATEKEITQPKDVITGIAAGEIEVSSKKDAKGPNTVLIASVIFIIGIIIGVGSSYAFRRKK